MARDGLVPEKTEPPHLVLCGAPDEETFNKLMLPVANAGIRYRSFVEAGMLTAIVTEPVSGENRKLFKKWQCLKQNLPQTS